MFIKNNIKRRSLIIYFLIFIVILAVSLYFSFNFPKKSSDINLDFEQEQIIEEKPKLSCKEKLDEYRVQYNNYDIVAEVEVVGTTIKSIVTQTGDNEFYLNHSLSKEYDPVGVVFMDYRVNINSRKILLYGHNSQTIDTVFHRLENYLNKDFYDLHPNITLYTDEDTFLYKIFSVMIVVNDYQYFLTDFTDEMWLPHLNNLKSRSIYDTGVSLDKDDEVLILQTCFYNPMNSYLVISAKKI